MRSFLIAIGVTLSLIVPAFAAGPASSGVPVKSLDKTDKQRLDELFIDLKKAANDKAAARVASRIWDSWNNSGSASIDLMMRWAKKAMVEQKFDVALDFLDQVVTMKPDYAEGWNQRATTHFMMHNFAKSMADIEKTLELEPRHFGALSGMGQILKARGDKELALAAFLDVLSIYPMMRNIQNEVSTLSEEMAGEAI